MGTEETAWRKLGGLCGDAAHILRGMSKRRSKSAVVSAAMSMLGRVGAIARAESLSAKRRSEIARKAAAASARVRSAKARKRRAAEKEAR